MTDDQKSESAVLSKSMTFNLDELPMRTMPNGGKSWDVVHGTLVTGETIAVHDSMQPANLPPNPPHKIAHSEFIFVREGTLEFQHEGKSERVSAGGVIFVGLGTMHTARNVGEGPATYFVISIGGDTR
ncbi:MAG TPA: cupin domain-containing protein [Terriglobales bacterium]|jgi:mannose-6-phosphate isomerase-like protein (cupin superfamily)|nr:cupin domain-containing protein [Terriglobales bacterium]